MDIKKFLAGCVVFLSLVRFCSGSGYINVKDFIEKEEYKNEKDHTAAIRAAFEEAAKTRKWAVFFPPGYYTISDTINISSAGEIVGEGYPTIIQTNPEKDIFYDENTWRKTIRGLQFRGGKDQIAIGNKNVDQGFFIISDCRFFNSEGA
ncbi:MAG: glycoside hydrolase family 55 protein, partial [Candidatus Omnitrophica bacterium]|nr:glycoside hydrolase family 55 protein [Candidatus Omnitrophota bacterium]